MKIGITGSNGFIGKHLIKTLDAKENIQLSYFNLPKDDLLKPTFLRNFVFGKDIVIHTAAINKGSDAEIISGSVVATYNLVSAISKLKVKPKLIFLSSIQAETDTVYGLSKKLTEVMLQSFSKDYKIPVSIFRVANVFGENCKPFYNSVVATFCYQTANNKKITIKVKRKKVNFVYVKDLVKIISKEIFIRRKKLFYFKRVSSNNIITIGRLASLINSFKHLKNSKKLKSKFNKDLYNTYLSYSKQ